MNDFISWFSNFYLFVLLVPLPALAFGCAGLCVCGLTAGPFLMEEDWDEDWWREFIKTLFRRLSRPWHIFVREEGEYTLGFALDDVVFANILILIGYTFLFYLVNLPRQDWHPIIPLWLFWDVLFYASCTVAVAYLVRSVFRVGRKARKLTSAYNNHCDNLHDGQGRVET